MYDVQVMSEVLQAHLKRLQATRDSGDLAEALKAARTEMHRRLPDDGEFVGISDRLNALMDIDEGHITSDLTDALDKTPVGRLVGNIHGLGMDMKTIMPYDPLQQMAAPGVDMQNVVSLSPEERLACRRDLSNTWATIDQAKQGTTEEQIAATALEVALAEHYQQKQIDSPGHGR